MENEKNLIKDIRKANIAELIVWKIELKNQIEKANKIIEKIDIEIKTKQEILKGENK